MGFIPQNGSSKVAERRASLCANSLITRYPLNHIQSPHPENLLFRPKAFQLDHLLTIMPGARFAQILDLIPNLTD